MRKNCFPLHLTGLLFGLVLFTLSGCSPKIYEAPNMEALTARHQVIALIPPVVTIKGRPKDDPEALKEAALADSYNYQREMYSWMLRRKQQGRIRNLEIMDVESTNAKLERAGYTAESRALTPKELAEILDVDAVITTRFNMSKPMSQGAAIAVGILFGVGGTTNQSNVYIDINDAEQGMIWNYNWEASGGVFNSANDLVEALMRNASKRMPYTVN